MTSVEKLKALLAEEFHCPLSPGATSTYQECQSRGMACGCSRFTHRAAAISEVVTRVNNERWARARRRGELNCVREGDQSGV